MSGALRRALGNISNVQSRNLTRVNQDIRNRANQGRLDGNTRWIDAIRTAIRTRKEYAAKGQFETAIAIQKVATACFSPFHPSPRWNQALADLESSLQRRMYILSTHISLHTTNVYFRETCTTIAATQAAQARQADCQEAENSQRHTAEDIAAQQADALYPETDRPAQRASEQERQQVHQGADHTAHPNGRVFYV